MTDEAARPLSGIRVLDLTQVWAGPLCVQLLADYGADVIKVDSRERAVEQHARQLQMKASRPTSTRGETLELLDSLMRNRRPLTLDLARPEGREIVALLASEVDVLVENFTARVMREWGLGYSELQKANPRLIMVSLSPAGHAGPWSGVLTYGPSLTSLYGTKSLLGYPGEAAPVEDMSEADPIAGMYGFYASVAAIHEREASGVGRHLDLAQGEAPLIHALEGLLDAQAGLPIPRGNQSSSMAPQGIYRCAGEDEWVALTVEDDDDWNALAGLIGQPDLVARYPTLDDRVQGADAIDTTIEAWTSQRSPSVAEAALLGAGLAVLPAWSNLEQFEDPHLRYRRALGLKVPGLADVAEITNSAPIKLSATPAAILSGEPSFLEPQIGPLREIGSLDEERIEGLIDAGVF